MPSRVAPKARPGWRFIGVHPSAEMSDLARSTLGPLVSRVEFVEGINRIHVQGPGRFHAPIARGTR